jgi:twitching motility protein PilT
MSPSLSSSPDLAQIKRQAKELLKAHKAGDPSVCGTLRKVRRFAEMTDNEVLRADIKLAEAQHATAKDYGFNTWADLRSAVEAANTPATGSTCKHALLEQALCEAAQRGASDIHLVAGEPLTFRVSGAIVRSEGVPVSADEIRAAAIAQVGAEALSNIKSTGGIVTRCSVEGVAKGRATVSTSRDEIRIVIVLVDEMVLDHRAAGLPRGILDVGAAKSGLVVFGGQVGSGYRTAATSFIDYINQTRPVHVVTIEDPVSGRITPRQAIVQQREVGTDIPDTLAGIKFAIAQDVDVLYVPEMRATVELTAALTAAEAGLLVVITVHGRSADEVMDRIVSAFPVDERQTYRKRLARTLLAISVQTLLARDDSSGRVAAYGVFLPDAEARQAIAEGRPLDSSDVLSPGCQRMVDHVRELLAAGVVSEETAAAELERIK